MENISPRTERRRHQRYGLSCLVIAVPQKSDSEVARIVNISKGGMAVRYVDQKDWLGDASKLDILLNSSFFMTGVPIKNIRDFGIDNHFSFSMIRERQCCLQFGSLSPEQESLLDEFIMKHTDGHS